MTIDILKIYDDIAAWFDATRSHSLMERPYLDRALSLSGAAPAVLDVGCGSGRPIAAYLIEQGARLTGIDGSAAMIALCKGTFATQEWLVADMRGLALGRKFNIIIAWHSFFHLTADEQRAMFATFAAHLDAGGILVFTSGSQAGTAWGDMQGHKIHHASLDAAEYRALAAHHDFDVIDHSVDDAQCGGATVWTLRYRGAA